MKGVNALNAEDFQIQAQKLINLDTAWDQVMVEGSAMGVAGVFTKLLAWEVSDSIHWYEIQIDGLTGGHSGTQSYKRGANGIRLMGGIPEKNSGEMGSGFIRIKRMGQWYFQSRRGYTWSSR